LILCIEENKTISPNLVYFSWTLLCRSRNDRYLFSSKQPIIRVIRIFRATWLLCVHVALDNKETFGKLNLIVCLSQILFFLRARGTTVHGYTK